MAEALDDTHWSDDTDWLDDTEAAAWKAFVVGATNLFSRLEADLMAAADLSHLDYGILAELSDSPEHMLRMSTLAAAYGVDPSVITYRVKRMADRGLVERATCPTDRRGVNAVLTADGQAALDALAPTHVEAVRREFIDHLSSTELRAIASAFTKLVAHQQSDD